MIKIKCPKCKQEVDIDIANAIDEHGETYICPYCRWKLRYVAE